MGRQDHGSVDIGWRTDAVYTISICSTDRENARRQGRIPKRQYSEETVGKNGLGSRNREGQDLVAMLAKNQLVVVNSFFQKRESHKITYRSGNSRKYIF